MIPQAGKIYHVEHQRQGDFDVEALKVFKDRAGEHWVSGPLIAVYGGADRSPGEVGDHVTVRVSLATFTEIHS